MICSLTHVAKSSPMIRGGYQQAVNVTDGECAATLTTRYEVDRTHQYPYACALSNDSSII